MKAFTGVILATTALTIPNFVRAADAPPAAPASAASAQELTEIVVTAQKRTERLRDVPISVTAASGELLARQNLTAPSDLERIVPGFSYEKSSYGPPVFSIRGIGVYDTFVGMSPTVTVYVDQVQYPYLAMAAGAGLDLERVEVLKGPQGTLFGQNATGGAINYIAAKPTAEPKAGLDVTYGSFNEIDPQAFISGPLSDTVSARLSVRHEARDGWQYSLSRPGDKLGKKDFTAGRLLLDWKPSDRLKFELNLNGWQDKSDTQAAQFVQFAQAVPNGVPISLPLANTPVAPESPGAADWLANTPLKHNDHLEQVALRGDYQLDNWGTLTSISSYDRYRTNSTVDTDGTPGIDLGGTYVPNFLMNPQATITSLSQEFRLAGAVDRLKYTAGVNYQQDKIAYDEHLIYNGSNSGAAFPWGSFFNNELQNINDQHVETASGFASLEYALTPQLTAIAAARYSYQWRRFHGCAADGGNGALAAAFFAPIPGNTEAGPGQCTTWTSNVDPIRLPNGVNSTLDQGNTPWRIGLNWKPDRDTLVYANITKGFKAGSFTPVPAVTAAQLAPVTQESVLAYEVGAKSGFFANRVLVSAAAFHYDYQNKQILGYELIAPFGPLPALLNVPKGSVDGAEAELTLRPIKALRLTGGVSYVDSSVDSATPGFDPYANPITLKGEAFPNAPKWQYVLDGQYDFAATTALNAYVGGGITARSSTYAAFGEDPNFRIKGYALLSLRAGLESADGHWRLQIFGNNVTDKFYVINVSHLTDTVDRTTGMPATFGVTLGYRY